MRAKRLSVDCQILSLLLDHGPQYQKALVIDSGRDYRSVGLRLEMMERVGLVEHRSEGTSNVWSIGERVRLGAMRDAPRMDEE